ncbi:hypothetical protein KTN00_03485 [Acinetobacter soli]|uniref:hypothetical protein n=1 Tax=Acinetobacter soli TaxID=487316 RepID=UPI001C483E0E|nr:hypothetical protein [Acinetobacter soli]MBV6550093.1 hypothetical protein [Acinetobacter soli]
MQKDLNDSDLSFWQRMDELIGDERPYPWAERIGINRSAFQSARTRGKKPLPKTVKAWSDKIGCSYEWLSTGEGEPFQSDDEQQNQSYDSCLTEEGLVISTQIDRAKLQQAFATTEQALLDQKKTMQPDAKSEFIVMLYTALIDKEIQPFNNQLLTTAIFNVENELKNARRSMSPDKKTLLIIAIYTLYSDDALNNKAIAQTTIQLVRSAA